MPLRANDQLCPLGRFMSRLGYLFGAATRATVGLLAQAKPMASLLQRRAALQPVPLRMKAHWAKPDENVADLVHTYPALARALRDPDPLARFQLLDNLDELDQEQAQVVLLELLNDPNPKLRAAAAATAARSRLSSLVFALILALDDPDAAAQEQARRSLIQLTGQRIQLDASLSREERQQQIEALKDWWKEQRLSQLRAAAEPPA